jgi:hypothetical protein
MKTRVRAPLAVAIAIGFGLVVLLGYFFGENAAGELTTLGILRDYFLQGAVIVGGVALLVGVFNLASVHARKIRRGEGALYSAVTLTALILTVLVGFYDLTMTYTQGAPGLHWTRWIFENIQLPVETSLMAVLLVSLTFAATRLLSRRLDLMSGVFVAFVFVLLVTAIPVLTARFGLLAEIREWILSVPAVGGARGILLGVALGIVATGIRILTGADRPYGG